MRLRVTPATPRAVPPEERFPEAPGGACATDLELVERVRGGDVDSYEVLVRRYQGQVFSHAQRMLGSADEAADLTQEVLIKVYSTLNQFRGQASFQTWVYRVTANLCVDRHRRRQRSPQVARSLDAPLETESGELEFEIPDWDGEPQAWVMTRELGEQVRAAMGELSEKLRAVIVMHDLEGLSYEEIASALRIPLGTVKSRLFHARAALKKLLEPYIGSDPPNQAGRRVA